MAYPLSNCDCDRRFASSTFEIDRWHDAPRQISSGHDRVPVDLPHLMLDAGGTTACCRKRHLATASARLASEATQRRHASMRITYSTTGRQPDIGIGAQYVACSTQTAGRSASLLGGRVRSFETSRNRLVGPNTGRRNLFLLCRAAQVPQFAKI